MRPQEQRVFDLLLAKEGKVVSHLSLGVAVDGRLRADLDHIGLDRLVHRIRRRLKGTPYEGRINNIRGVGYIMEKAAA